MTTKRPAEYEDEDLQPGDPRLKKNLRLTEEEIESSKPKQHAVIIMEHSKEETEPTLLAKSGLMDSEAACYNAIAEDPVFIKHLLKQYDYPNLSEHVMDESWKPILLRVAVESVEQVKKEASTAFNYNPDDDDEDIFAGDEWIHLTDVSDVCKAVTKVVAPKFISAVLKELGTTNKAFKDIIAHFTDETDMYDFYASVTHLEF